MYPECFGGIGRFINFEYHIKLEENARSVVHPAILRGKLEKELQNMVDQGIIASVGNAKYEWFNSLVIREHPDGRLCTYLDPKGLSKVIKREHHPVPTVDDITQSLGGATLLFKLDAAQDYCNGPVNKGITSLDNIQQTQG